MLDRVVIEKVLKEIARRGENSVGICGGTGSYQCVM